MRAIAGGRWARGVVLALLTLGVALPGARAESEGQVIPVSVGVGGSRLVRFRLGAERFTIADPNIVEAKLLNARALQVGGRQLGETAIIVWDSRGTPVRLVVSVGVPTEGLAARLKSIFPSETIGVQSSGETIILTGSVSDPVVAERAVKVAEAHLASAMAQTITAGGAVGGPAAAGATTSSEVVTGRGGNAAGARVLNFLDIKGRQQVQVRAKVAEVSRTALRQMGVNVWARTNPTKAGSGAAAGMLAPGSKLGDVAPNTPAGLQAESEAGEGGAGATPLLGGPVAESFGFFLATGAASALPISVALSLMQGRQLAKILSEPTLVAYSGQRAEFLAGGEFPVPVPQGLGSTSIEYKKYGVELSFTPTVLAGNTIHLDVAVTVSEREPGAVTILGTAVPALRSRYGRTTIRLRNGQSFAIAGLLQDQISASVSKVPLLGDLPILGALFRQKTFTREERELVILVTAELVRPLKPGEVPALPGEDEVSDPGAVAFFLLGSIDPELKGSRRGAPAGPVGYGK
ncbi:MAG: type II and III secretion system protein family protein [Proteobacteria bacterium]|nr:type II and III secretion system protein family protein [Pseudomonadota bacterium]